MRRPVALVSLVGGCTPLVTPLLNELHDGRAGRTLLCAEEVNAAGRRVACLLGAGGRDLSNWIFVPRRQADVLMCVVLSDCSSFRFAWLGIDRNALIG